MKKIISIMTALCIVSMNLIVTFAVDEPNLSRELKTIDNRVVYADDETTVHLTGMNPYVYDLFKEEATMRYAFIEAMDNWHCNILRFPIENKDKDLILTQEYVDLVASFVDEVAKRGKYVIIDLHNYEKVTQYDMDFWAIYADRFKNNPAVLFGLLNEPHTVSWEEWRNGGVSVDKDGNETKFYGHQQLVEMIRDMGARNILIAAGLDWGYDLRGIVGEAEGDDKVYALVDQGSNGDLSKAGNGIMYDSHIYPWKGMKEWIAEGEEEDALERAIRDWKDLTHTARLTHPTFSGENGWDAGTIEVILEFTPGFEDKDVRSRAMSELFQEGQTMYHDRWVTALHEYFYDTETYGVPMNYAAWCFAPNSSPLILEREIDRENWGKEEYSFPPTAFWGEYVKTDLKKAAVRRGEVKDTIIVTLNGREVMFDVPPQEIGGRVLVPIRAVLEGIGYDVDWDDEAQTVLINSK